jgi:hypothetical protein
MATEPGGFKESAKYFEAKAIILQKLAMAERHIKEGREIVARQCALITKRKEFGLESTDAEKLLAQFMRTLEIFEDDYLTVKNQLESLLQSK